MTPITFPFAAALVRDIGDADAAEALEVFHVRDIRHRRTRSLRAVLPLAHVRIVQADQ